MRPLTSDPYKGKGPYEGPMVLTLDFNKGPARNARVFAELWGFRGFRNSGFGVQLRVESLRFTV